MTLSLRSTPAGDRFTVLSDPGLVWRVGYRPEPWHWTPWTYAVDGRFNGRWDDPNGQYRTLYAGDSLLGCLLEVLAAFRPDVGLIDDLDDIEADPQDADHLTVTPGEISVSWLQPRAASRATLTGDYCHVTTGESLSTLRPRFLARALHLGLPDLDAAVLKLATPRALTQSISSWLYRHTRAGRAVFDGVRFLSRHGDDLGLFAVFERSTDDDSTSHISDQQHYDLHAEHPDLVRAMQIHHLTWGP